MASSVRGTSAAMMIFTAMNAARNAISQKCTMRAVSKLPINSRSNGNCTDLQIARRETTSKIKFRMTET